MALINIKDFEPTKGKKINLDSLILKAGVKQLRKKKMVTKESNEDVIDPFELLLEMWEIRLKADKYRGNTNGRKK